MLTQNYLATKTGEFQKRIGTYESQLLFIHMKLYKMILHLQDHKADYSCIKGLKKLLKQREQMFRCLMLQNFLKASELMKISNELDRWLHEEGINEIDDENIIINKNNMNENNMNENNMNERKNKSNYKKNKINEPKNKGNENNNKINDVQDDVNVNVKNMKLNPVQDFNNGI